MARNGNWLYAAVSWFTICVTLFDAAAADDPPAVADSHDPAASLSAKHPNDVGLAEDPDVLFADDFESGDLSRWNERRGWPAAQSVWFDDVVVARRYIGPIYQP